MQLRSHLLAGALALALVFSTAQMVVHSGSFDAVVAHDFAFAAHRLEATDGTLDPPNYPWQTDGSGSWDTTSADKWGSGFFPGSLWLMYERTGDPVWRSRAQRWQAALESQKNNTSTHDLGFIIFNTFGNGYRLTGDDSYRQIVLKAAESLAKRYNTAVGCIRSWGSMNDTSNFQVIIDNMMNLELLFWASKHGGKSEWYDIALSHAVRTMQEHVRPDGSTYHVVNYDPATGAVKSKTTAQGYSAESTWSRGQAWAIYGFTMAFRETGDTRFLETARKTADYFISHLPSDHVPYWDFQAPGIPNEPRDSSAAAIAASALLELSRLEQDSGRGSRYQATARDILVSLSSPLYLSEGTSNQAVLLHGTRHKPHNNYDTGLIWGDYYFLEGLLRYIQAPAALGGIAGHVTARDSGSSISGATIAYDGGKTTTNTPGQYMLRNLLPGTYTLTISATNYISATATVAVTAGITTTLDVVLTPNSNSNELNSKLFLPLTTMR
jgi:unsaturated chondroitin disaccharide hydrolase